MNLSGRWIPNNLCRYLVFRKLRLKCHGPVDSPWIVTSFQRGPYRRNGKNRIASPWGHLRDMISTSCSRLTSAGSHLLDGTLERLQWEWYCISMVFLPRTHSPGLTMRKTSDNPRPPGGGILQNAWRILLKSVQTRKLSSNTRAVRHGHSPQEPKETWQLNEMWYLGQDPKRGGQEVKNEGNLKKLIILYQYSFISCGKCRRKNERHVRNSPD